MAEPTDTEQNYLAEVLGHPASVSGLLGAVTAGAVMSMVTGGAAALIPLLLWGGAEALAALFLPGSPVFREWVDRKRRAERREARRTDLNARISKKVSELQTEARVGRRGAAPLLDELEDYGTQYARMRERLAAMTRMVSTGQVSVHTTELEKLDDATVDFLRLAWARIVMSERLDDHDERDLTRQVKELEHQLGQAATPVEERKLKQAITELNRVMERRRLLPAQDAATRAQLMGMVDAFEELYHHLNTEGGGAEVSRYLREATERLHVEEELQASVEVEMEEIARKAAGRRRATE